jgi:hypothetical protein
MPGDRENVVRLDAGHGGVCRFGSEITDEDNLKLVLRNVKDLYVNAIQIGECSLRTGGQEGTFEESIELRLSNLRA